MFASIKESQDVDNRTEFSVQEVGILTPQSLRTGQLRCGQVGYVISGLRSTRQARIGDTMYITDQWVNSTIPLQPLSGYEKAKPMLFASIYPVDSSEVDELFSSVDRLLLNDSSISVSKEQSVALGSGLRCGFLGFLHMEVFNQRLKDEFDMEIVMVKYFAFDWFVCLRFLSFFSTFNRQLHQFLTRFATMQTVQIKIT